MRGDSLRRTFITHVLSAIALLAIVLMAVGACSAKEPADSEAAPVDKAAQEKATPAAPATPATPAKKEEKQPEKKADEKAKGLTAGLALPEPVVLSEVKAPSLDYPKFDGVRLALAHTENVMGELEPCG